MATVTDAQNAASLKSARNVAATRLGVDPDNLSYEQRTAFNKELAKVITTYPQNFSDQTVATAQRVLNTNYEPLADTSFDWDQFQQEVTNNALDIGNSVADVGRGVTTTLSMAKWLLPIGALVFVGLFIWRRAK